MLSSFKKISFFGLGQVSVYAFFAFLPFQIDALVVSASVYFSGFFNPYLSHFIYLSDIFLLLGLLFFGISYALNSENKFWKKIDFKLDGFKWGVLSFLLISLLSLFFASNFSNSLIYFARMFEFFLLFLFIASGFLDLKKLVYVFLGTLSFVSLIGIFQYLAQESLGLRFFGEPVLTSMTLGVAKVDVFSDKVVRIYGTFPHPNIFASYLVFGMFFSSGFIKNRYIQFVLYALFGLALILTFSRTAIFAFFFSSILYLYLSRLRPSFRALGIGALVILVLGVLLGFLPVLYERLILADLHTFSERNLYMGISHNMFSENIFGVGGGNFTNVMQDFSFTKLDPWLYQPVHNIFFLIFNEVGFLGGFSFVFLFIYLLFSFMKKALVVSKKHERLVFMMTALWIFIVITGFFDHYYISLYQGQALFWVYLGVSAYVLRLE